MAEFPKCDSAVYDDLVHLPVTDDDSSILTCLQKRFENQRYLTWIGLVLISINPFGSLEKEKITRNPDLADAKSQPTIYSISKMAYSALRDSNSNQSILISGESGSGKTESTKQCLNSLIELSAPPTQVDFGVGLSDENRLARLVLASSPILEAFGNASTIRNASSSRYGKWITLQFQSSGTSFSQAPSLKGAQIDCYLLEKSRVSLSNRDPKEGCNYHIFYGLISKNDPTWFLTGRESSYQYIHSDQDTRIVNAGSIDAGLHKLPRCRSNHSLLDEVEEAFLILGLDPTEIGSILRIAAAILHLGNIDFHPIAGASDDSCAVYVPSCVSSAMPLSSDNVLSERDEYAQRQFEEDREKNVLPGDDAVRHCASLLQITPESLQQALCSRIMSSSQKDNCIRIGLNVQAAKDARDSLARALYHALFLTIVSKINHSLATASKMTTPCQYKPSSPSNIQAEQSRRMSSSSSDRDGGAFSGLTHSRNTEASIGILDIFGFESFESNSFEQLCINYSNEVLQNHFNGVIFRREKEIYEAEGLNDIDFIAYNDNFHVVRDIENLFKSLDEESRIPKGTSKSWYDKHSRLYPANAATAAPASAAFSKGTQIVPATKLKSVAFPRTQRLDLFVVTHFAGDVKYAAASMVEKNAEALRSDLIDVIAASSCRLVASLFVAPSPISSSGSAQIEISAPIVSQNKNGDSGKENKDPLVVGLRNKPAPGTLTRQSLSRVFLSQLGALTESIRASQCHFVRCIKSNQGCQPLAFEAPFVQSQLRYSGVYEIAAIQRSGLPSRQNHSVFFDRYFCILPRTARPKFTMKKKNRCEYLDEGNNCLISRSAVSFTEEFVAAFPSTVLEKITHMRIGTTLVFMKAAEQAYLDQTREKCISQASICLQRNLRMFVTRHLVRGILARIFAIRDSMSRAWVEMMSETHLYSSIEAMKAALDLTHERACAEDLIFYADRLNHATRGKGMGPGRKCDDVRDRLSRLSHQVDVLLQIKEAMYFSKEDELKVLHGLIDVARAADLKDEPIVVYCSNVSAQHSLATAFIDRYYDDLASHYSRQDEPNDGLCTDFVARSTNCTYTLSFSAAEAAYGAVSKFVGITPKAAEMAQLLSSWLRETQREMQHVYSPLLKALQDSFLSFDEESLQLQPSSASQLLDDNMSTSSLPLEALLTELRKRVNGNIPSLRLILHCRETIQILNDASVFLKLRNELIPAKDVAAVKKMLDEASAPGSDFGEELRRQFEDSFRPWAETHLLISELKDALGWNFVPGLHESVAGFEGAHAGSIVVAQLSERLRSLRRVNSPQQRTRLSSGTLTEHSVEGLRVRRGPNDAESVMHAAQWAMELHAAWSSNDFDSLQQLCIRANAAIASYTLSYHRATSIASPTAFSVTEGEKIDAGEQGRQIGHCDMSLDAATFRQYPYLVSDVGHSWWHIRHSRVLQSLTLQILSDSRFSAAVAATMIEPAQRPGTSKRNKTNVSSVSMSTGWVELVRGRKQDLQRIDSAKKFLLQSIQSNITSYPGEDSRLDSDCRRRLTTLIGLSHTVLALRQAICKKDGESAKGLLRTMKQLLLQQQQQETIHYRALGAVGGGAGIFTEDCKRALEILNVEVTSCDLLLQIIRIERTLLSALNQCNDQAKAEAKLVSTCTSEGEFNPDSDRGDREFFFSHAYSLQSSIDSCDATFPAVTSSNSDHHHGRDHHSLRDVGAIPVVIGRLRSLAQYFLSGFDSLCNGRMNCCAACRIQFCCPFDRIIDGDAEDPRGTNVKGTTAKDAFVPCAVMGSGEKYDLDKDCNSVAAPCFARIADELMTTHDTDSMNGDLLRCYGAVYSRMLRACQRRSIVSASQYVIAKACVIGTFDVDLAVDGVALSSCVSVMDVHVKPLWVSLLCGKSNPDSQSELGHLKSLSRLSTRLVTLRKAVGAAIEAGYVYGPHKNINEEQIENVSDSLWARVRRICRSCSLLLAVIREQYEGGQNHSMQPPLFALCQEEIAVVQLAIDTRILLQQATQMLTSNWAPIVRNVISGKVNGVLYSRPQSEHAGQEESVGEFIARFEACMTPVKRLQGPAARALNSSHEAVIAVLRYVSIITLQRQRCWGEDDWDESLFEDVCVSMEKSGLDTARAREALSSVRTANALSKLCSLFGCDDYKNDLQCGGCDGSCPLVMCDEMAAARRTGQLLELKADVSCSTGGEGAFCASSGCISVSDWVDAAILVNSLITVITENNNNNDHLSLQQQQGRQDRIIASCARLENALRTLASSSCSAYTSTLALSFSPILPEKEAQKNHHPSQHAAGNSCGGDNHRKQTLFSRMAWAHLAYGYQRALDAELDRWKE